MNHPGGRKRAWKAQTPSCALLFPLLHTRAPGQPGKWVRPPTPDFFFFFSGNNRQGGELRALDTALAHPMPSDLCW